MIVQGPKLEMRQLILARLVDIGTELAVAGLAISRVQGELNRQNSRNFETVLYWLHSAMIRIDGLFKEVGTNSDKEAVKLAKQLMDNAELLTEVDTSHLGAIEREFGRDLTNGEVGEVAREKLLWECLFQGRAKKHPRKK